MYDLDQFRNFVFKSKFLSIFNVDEEVLQKIWDDDEDLLKFGYQYLKMMLNIEKTLEVREQPGSGNESTLTTF